MFATNLGFFRYALARSRRFKDMQIPYTFGFRHKPKHPPPTELTNYARCQSHTPTEQPTKYKDSPPRWRFRFKLHWPQTFGKISRRFSAFLNVKIFSIQYFEAEETTSVTGATPRRLSGPRQNARQVHLRAFDIWQDRFLGLINFKINDKRNFKLSVCFFLEMWCQNFSSREIAFIWIQIKINNARCITRLIARRPRGFCSSIAWELHVLQMKQVKFGAGCISKWLWS